jgi:hypothetical protein
MDEPTAEEKNAVLTQRLRELRVKHYLLDLDKVAAMATSADDAAEVVAQIEAAQANIDKAYEALKEMQ